MCIFCTESRSGQAHCVDCGKDVCADSHSESHYPAPLYASESGDGPLCPNCTNRHDEADEAEGDDYGYEFNPYL